ncbi:flagellar export protein FliJ [Hydrogenophaga sp. OTU3427]|uniref:flagellar export protein FliJ n=1 Tax=Hydrogenophaga sp. OTU3427 TaxID=3043856 RepID=UPI00313ABEA4
MANLDSFDRVVEVNTMRRDDALRALGQARQAQDHAEQQLRQLQDYSVEAEMRWKHRASQGVTPQLLHHHRQFMARIDEAVRFQDDVIAKLVAEVARCEQVVHLAERELASLSKYVERKRMEQQQHLERQDQKRNDEMAANVHRRQQLAQNWRP